MKKTNDKDNRPLKEYLLKKQSNIFALQGLIDNKILDKEMLDSLEEELIGFLIEKATMFEKNPEINHFLRDRECNLQ